MMRLSQRFSWSSSCCNSFNKKEVFRLKKIIAILLCVSLVMLFVAPVSAAPSGAPDAQKLYQLNIIGVQNPKTALMDDSSGRVIFVPMTGPAKIELQEGEFAVLDGNATDGAARFQLPKPGLDPYVVGQDMTDVDTLSDYSVYVRSLGKPGGWTTITTCADLVDSSFAGLLSGTFVKALNRAGEFGGYASVEQVGQDITMRTKGKTSFTNVTAELTTIVFRVEVDTTGDGLTDIIQYVRVPIFDDIIQGEYWEYDNHGLKLLQVRFYDCQTDVSLSDDPSWFPAI